MLPGSVLESQTALFGFTGRASMRVLNMESFGVPWQPLMTCFGTTSAGAVYNPSGVIDPTLPFTKVKHSTLVLLTALLLR